MLLSNLDVLATAPGGVARLRELILTLAVQGKLLPQDPEDEPASVLLKKIRAEKDRLIAEGKIKRDKLLPPIAEDEQPFELPVGWEWVKAIDICALITDGDHLPPPKADSGVPFLVIGDVRNGTVDLQRVSRRVPTEYFEKLDWGKRPLVGDILYTTVGSFGIPVPVVAQEDFCFQRHIALFRPAMQELQNCMGVMLRSSFIYRQAEAGATGIAQKTVPLSTLRGFRIPLPPLAEQSRIVTRVEELMRLCDALEAKGQLEATQHAQLVSTLLGQLTASSTPDELHENWQRVAQHFDLLLDRPAAVDALEQTILQLAVRGLLVPQDPTDEPASILLQKIRVEKDRLIAEGKIKRDKPQAPIAEEEKPFEVPVGWEWVRLGLLTSLVTSGSRSWKDFYAAEGATFIRSQDIKYDRLEFDDRAFVKLPRGAEGVRTQVRIHDLLITITGANVGKAAAVTESISEAYVSQHVALVRLLNVGLVNCIHRWLVSELEGRKLLLMRSYGAKRGLNLQNINDLLVPLPPIVEQSRIVTRVESLRRLCADLRQRLAERQAVQADLAEALVANNAQTSTPRKDACHAA